MQKLTLFRSLARRIHDLPAWQRAVLGLLILSMLWNAAQAALIGRLEADCRETAEQLALAQHARDYAVRQLGAMSLQTKQEKEARAQQAAAYEAVGAYRYIGECTITAYCPCAACCGQWADGLTATGLPAVPGIVSVDPEVIPLGSTVVIDGQRYLAADTGVKGQAVDICVADHQEAEAVGVQTAEVWIIRGDKP